jgi:CheY-like chemotaxis protein/two-component sensor histidine kinase
MIAGERGRALVDRILAFSRSGVGERVAVCVEDVVRETLALFTAKLPPNIAIEERLRASRAAVMGDATQIHQVLMNLVTNSVQAMPSGGTVRVSLDRQSVDAPRSVTTGTIEVGEYVVLEVRDTGGGIPTGIVEKIFDPFFTTKDVGVGTGLGLSLVHGIVTGLGGVIDVATTVGKGTVFTVYLPRTADVAPRHDAAKRDETPAQRPGEGRILVVDDEALLLRLATETLSDLGYTMVGFSASAAALAVFLADPDRFDAVITDESMPGLSGSDLISRIRAVKPRVPIVLVTGLVNASVVQRAKDAGATEVLRKPLSSRQLAMSVERVLLESRLEARETPAPSPASARAAQPRRRGASSRIGPQRR